MKSLVKKILRNYAPVSIYKFIYISYQKYNKHGLSDFKISSYANFTKKGFYPFTLDGTNFDIYLNPNNGGVDSEIFSDGHYEVGILRIIKKYATPSGVFLDIGANIGQHSLYAANFYSQVHSFEPISRICNQFSKSILKNNIKNISAHNYALGAEKKSVAIYGDDRNIGASSILVSEKRHKIQDVEVVRLDDVYKKIGIDRVDLIKVDVEGYELDVLLGAEELIKKYKPVIILEYSPYLYNRVDGSISHKILSVLFSFGYTIVDIGSGEKNIIIKNTDDIIDTNQTNILCY